MDQVSVAHAKEHLEELIERARRGEDVRIADDKGALVKLQAVEPPATVKRLPGRWKDRIPPPPDDFFDPLSRDELKLWYGDDG